MADSLSAGRCLCQGRTHSWQANTQGPLPGRTHRGEAGTQAPPPPPYLLAGRPLCPSPCPSPSPSSCPWPSSWAVKQRASLSAAHATPSQRRDLVPGPLDVDVDATSQGELIYSREFIPGPDPATAGVAGAGVAITGASTDATTAGASYGVRDGATYSASDGASMGASAGRSAGWGRDREGGSGTILFPDAEQREEPARRFRFRNGREILEERAFLVGVQVGAYQGPTSSRRPNAEGRGSDQKRGRASSPSSSSAEGDSLARDKGESEGAGGARQRAEVGAEFPVEESLAELARLCETAGLQVIGSTFQRLEAPNPRTYIGSGKVAEVKAAVAALDAETVVFDDELSPGQLRSLERELGEGVRVCDRTALILDIFSQRAATKEATLQVELAQVEYQLPRLTRMWTHLERQAGGLVKGMGEKQIEVDKRILRDRMGALKASLRSVQAHRQQYRRHRAEVPLPVISLVGYTNAGKSSLMNRLSGAGVLAEDQLFATLDPTTRRIQLPTGKDCLLTDTVGFIQKLPTQLVAAFRATLEEICDATVLLHVVDASDPMACHQVRAVDGVLDQLGVSHIPCLRVLNKVDAIADPSNQPLLAFLGEERERERAHSRPRPRESDGAGPRGPDEGAGVAGASSVGALGRGGAQRQRERPAGGRNPGASGEAGGARVVAEGQDWIQVSALTGEGILELRRRLQALVNESLVQVEALIPFTSGHLLDLVYRLGAVSHQEHRAHGTLVSAHVPLRLAQILLPMRSVAAKEGRGKQD